MKVLFIKNVPGTGRIDDVREVADGFALNYLFPQNLAIRATVEAVAAAEKRRKSQVSSAALSVDRAKGFIQQLEGRVVKVKGQSSPGGTFYASVSADMLAHAIKDQLGVTVQPEQVKMNEHLKTLGDHQVSVKFGSLEASLKVRLEAL